MGTCNCKEDNGDSKTPKYEISVPNLPSNDLIEELKLSLKINNENTSASEVKNKCHVKLKSILKKNSLKQSATTESLLTKGKTSKGKPILLINGQDVENYINNPDNKLSFKTKNVKLHPKFQRFPTLLEKSNNSTYAKDSASLPLETNADDKRCESYSSDSFQVDFEIKNKGVVKEEENQLFNILSKHYLFENVGVNLIKIMIDEMKIFDVEEESYIYKEGEDGDCFFVIKKGRVEIQEDDESKRELGVGECFGELALIHKCIRSTSTVALTDCELYVLDGALYRELNQNKIKSKVGDIMSYIEVVPWLKTLNHQKKNLLARLIAIKDYKIGDILPKIAPENDEKIFIIKEGSITLFTEDNKEVKKFYTRNFFGVDWIINDSESFNHEQGDYYKITQPSSIFIIHRSSLEEAIGMEFKLFIMQSFISNLLSKNKFFSNFFIPSHYEYLYNIFEIKRYNNGQIVYDVNILSNKKVIIILEGSIVSADNHEILAKEAEIFGEEILNSVEDLPVKILASDSLVCFETTWDVIKTILKHLCSFSSIDIFKRLNKLRKVFIFKHLSESRCLQICNKMKKEKYQPNEIIFKQNTIGDKIYLLNKGRVQVIRNGKVIRELEEGAVFGEMALITDEKRNATLQALGKTQCYTLDKETFIEVIDDKIMDYLNKKICLEDAELKLSKLYTLTFLGKSKYGNIHLVHNGNYLYAVKSIPIKLCEIKKTIIKYMQSEKRTLLTIDHPFIVKLSKTMKNQNYVFFLTEFIEGLNMFEYLNNRKVRRNLEETKFYGALLFIIIDYLNSKGIAHRDIKPANVMIDKYGYLKLMDFGYSKKIVEFTHTVCGTPHYIAPEVIQGKGYSNSCDIWSVGVFIFFIFYGVLPFGNNTADTMEIYKEIINKDLTFPYCPNTFELNNLLATLINKSVGNRTSSISKIKGHTLYQDYNWDDLVDYKVKAPFVPKKLREWTSNLGNLSVNYETMLDKDKDLYNKHNFEEDYYIDYTKNWIDEF